MASNHNAVIVNAEGKFLQRAVFSVAKGTLLTEWVSEYPDAMESSLFAARRMLAKLAKYGHTCRAIVRYGMDTEQTFRT